MGSVDASWPGMRRSGSGVVVSLGSRALAHAARTLYLGLDACDLHLAQELARDGTMPVLARLLEEAASVETVGPAGYFVAGVWPTIYTGTTPARHRFLCSGQIVGGTYQGRWVDPVATPAPVWQQVSDAGRRVVVLDPPHAAAAEHLNGVQLVEYGCHDRHVRPASYPASFVDDVFEQFGPHPVGCLMREHPHFAPCDWVHRSGLHRTPAEDLALFDDLRDGHRRKAALSQSLLDGGDWDLFFSVFGETHCIGHQYWRLHDRSHPWHDASHLAAVGFDPVRAMYGIVDETIGRHLAAVDSETTVYVHLSHGMGPHYDGTWVLDPVLWRIDQYVDGSHARGPLSRAGEVAHAVAGRRGRSALTRPAAAARRRIARRVPMGYFDEEIPWLGARRWWAQPNDTGIGSVRLNLEHREPAGRIAATRARDVACWLADRLRDLVNVDTGAPAVNDVQLADDHYERTPGDALGDLFVEWNREAPIETVWSPATGIVRRPYDQWRSGDHRRDGLLLARGPGIAPGRRSRRMPVIDIAPTLAASLGIRLDAVDGVPRSDLVPGAGEVTPARTRSLRAFGEEVSAPPARVRRWRRSFEVAVTTRLERNIHGLEGSHHETYVLAQRAATEAAQLRAEVDALGARAGELERLASIAAVGAWLQQVDVPESSLVSVVMPTRNRSGRVADAIESVRRQQYERWELLVVDDGSDDDTWDVLQEAAGDDERIRPFRLDPHGGSSRARNLALDHAKGELIAYLDDDNRFDPGWLRAVVWAFTEYPESVFLYGARVIDDDDRHRTLTTRSLPVVQFLPWDGDGMLRANRIDQNVIAHRPSVFRYDERLERFNEWDLILQFTDDRAPLELPVVAVYYYSDLPDRITTGPLSERERESYEYVRAKTLRRRSGV